MMWYMCGVLTHHHPPYDMIANQRDKGTGRGTRKEERGKRQEARWKMDQSQDSSSAVPLDCIFDSYSNSIESS